MAKHNDYENNPHYKKIEVFVQKEHFEKIMKIMNAAFRRKIIEKKDNSSVSVELKPSKKIRNNLSYNWEHELAVVNWYESILEKHERGELHKRVTYTEIARKIGPLSNGNYLSSGQIRNILDKYGIRNTELSDTHKIAERRQKMKDIDSPNGERE